MAATIPIPIETPQTGAPKVQACRAERPMRPEITPTIDFIFCFLCAIIWSLMLFTRQVKVREKEIIKKTPIKL